jgi:geranylgeranyl reductase family protein
VERTWDCLIVGAGPAGATAAYHLAKAGRSVLLVEKAALPRPKVCGGGVSPQVGQWFDLDFSPVISTRVQTFRYTWAFGDPLDVDLGTTEPLWMVRREAFDHFLVQQAQALGAELKASCPVRGLRFEQGNWMLDTAEGPLAGRFLIAADGATGPLARWLGFTGRRRQVAGALEAEASGVVDRRDLAHLDFGSIQNGYLWNFPKADGHSLGIGVFQGRPDRDLREVLAAYAASFGLDLGTCSVSGHPVLCWNGDQPLHTQQALLAGEAACLVDPFTAEGIRPAIFSGLQAAQAIHRALDGEDRALEDYTRTIQVEWGTELRWARRIARAFYAAPALGWRRGVKAPGVPQGMARILCGEARYQQLAARALRRMRTAVFG